LSTSETADHGVSVWDIVRVDFPYADQPAKRRHRPALVIAVRRIDDRVAILWLLMITSARHSAWPHDAPVTALRGTGLPRTCIVRVAKVAVLEAQLAWKIGTLAVADRARVRDGLATLLGPVMEMP
jgi:mRNA interferase MazF